MLTATSGSRTGAKLRKLPIEVVLAARILSEGLMRVLDFP
jgi:hypothetical protein